MTEGDLTLDARRLGSARPPSGQARLRWGFGLSLAVHVAAGLGALLFVPSILRPDPPAVTFELVMPAPQAVVTPAPADPVSAPAAPDPSPSVAAAAEPLPAPPPPSLPEPAAPLPPEAVRPALPQHEPPRRPAVPARAPPREPLSRRQTELASVSAAPAASPAKPAASEATVVPPALPAHPSPTWFAGISAWLMEHRSYPEAARRLGQEGTAVVRFTVDHQGQVLDVNLVRSSGSDALDQAVQTLLRGAHLPPFPPDMVLPQQIVTVPIRYRLEP